ncbi:MAG TPA: 1-deoxy-D-xylulose-5-phosphate synthase [Dehalococcoidia bacterium]|nr:1-deoxy-D-xylulose-5-phosphate synthase [Dehalococcoidia bacterium]
MTDRLYTQNFQEALKQLSSEELDELCSEIREVLVKTVTETGGHLASNLGVVEFTVALHRVFNSPVDKIIWDAGHQSYVHKLLTGRQGRFSSLRQYKGISGFPDPAESEHDAFAAGHASTSISAALGMAIARDLAGEKHNVIAVIGDGSLTGGMAFEALNHAGHIGTRLIVMLIDNGMSISPTVGALSRALSSIRLDNRVKEAKKASIKFLSASNWGKKLESLINRLTRGAKAVAMPTFLWEELGFMYMGPFDGHSIADLTAAFEQAKHYTDGPVFLHIVTTKGKGFSAAEQSPQLYHSVSPKRTKQSDITPKIPTYSETFSDTMLTITRNDPKVVVITAAMSEGNCLQDVAKEFPERFFDVGICEEHAVTLAAGLAIRGFKPVVAIYSTFLQRAFDQILHDVCLQDLSVVFALDRGGIVGDDGKTHQGIFDLSYLSFMPNMIVAAPKDENELQHMLFTGVQNAHPMAIRYPRSPGLGVSLDADLHQLPAGKGELLVSGKDIAIIAIGAMVQPALAASQQLQKLGIDAAVFNARFARPLDSSSILDLAANTRKVLTVEENVLSSGFGAAVLELLSSSGISNIQVKRLGIPDEFVEHGPQHVLRAKYGLNAEGIVNEVASLLHAQRKQSVRTI